MELSYQGWSGCALRVDSGTPLFVDPAPGRELPTTEVLLLLTHGHPEHVIGALAHLRRADRAPVTVIATHKLCEFLSRRTARPEDSFVPVGPGDEVEKEGWAVRVFGWTHMSLLPPGATRAARYVLRLMSRPAALARMAISGARGPAHGPMIGFGIHRSGEDDSVVYFGEGLHRQTSRQELMNALGEGPVATLIFGVEPEDVDALPELLAGRDIGQALAFEPHREWRNEFGLPQIELSTLVTRLRDARVDALGLEAGDTVTLRSGLTTPGHATAERS